MSLPTWWYLTAYLLGAAWVLGWEIIAAWIDKGRGDTISEMTWWATTEAKVLWFALAGVLVWLMLHLLSRGRLC